jgi:hypothetical protein
MVNDANIPNHVKLESEKWRNKVMSIKTVPEQQAPSKLHKGGVVTCSSDYTDVIVALRESKPGVAFIVTLTDENLLKEEKPEVKFAYALRRYFESKGLLITAYKSGPREVTVRKATALDKRTRRKAA